VALQVQQLQLERSAFERGADSLAAVAPQLVMLFGSPAQLADGAMARQVRECVPDAILVGSSTAGEISTRGVGDASPVATAVRFDSASVHAVSERVHDNADSFAAGARLAARLPDEGLRAVIVFAPGVDVNGSALIRGMQSRLPPDVPLSGGLAADSGAFCGTVTVLDDVTDHRLIVALGLYGPSLVVSHGSFGGWQPFGPARKATRCSGNQLFELDGEPALSVYERYLGEYAPALPAAGLLFPLEMMTSRRQSTGVVRTLLSVDRDQGSLTLAGDIEPDGYLRLMHASAEALIDGARRAAHKARATSDGASLALLVSCVGRRLVMGPRVDEEVEAVAEVLGRGTVLAGYYSNGEISPDARLASSWLHNQTMTITTVGERA
jgi:hypothetical protein